MRRVFRIACCAALVGTMLQCSSNAIAQDHFSEGGETAGGQNPFEPAEADLEPSPAPAMQRSTPDEQSLLGKPAAPPVVDPFPIDVEGFAQTPAAAAQHELCRCVGEEALSPSVASIRTALRSPLGNNGLHFTDEALENVIDRLQEEYAIPIKIDAPALDDLGVQADQPVTFSVRGISLSAALRFMLKSLGLTYIIQDEMLLITTPDEAEKELKVCVYNVRDLVDPAKPEEIDTLREIIASCAATETWKVNGGGEAEIKPFRSGMLVISQTQAVHEEVTGLLEALRSQSKAEPNVAAMNQPVASPAAAAAGNQVVTRSYYLQINQQPGSESFAPTIRELITQSLPDEQWAGRLDNGDSVVLTVLPDRVVLRHRQSVQQKVESLLTDSGIASPPVAAGAMGRGGFGSGGFYNPRPADDE